MSHQPHCGCCACVATANPGRNPCELVKELEEKLQAIENAHRRLIDEASELDSMLKDARADNARWKIGAGERTRQLEYAWEKVQAVELKNYELMRRMAEYENGKLGTENVMLRGINSHLKEENLKLSISHKKTSKTLWEAQQALLRSGIKNGV